MELVVNGRFLLQDVTGVQRVGIEFVRALDRMLESGEYPGLDVELVVPARGDLVTTPPLRRVRLRRAGRTTSHLWEQVELPRLAGRRPLLCLGNTAPVPRLLTGRRAVHTMVHDLSYAYFPQAYSRAFRLLYSTVVPVALARSSTVFTVSRSEAAAMRERHPRLLAHDRLVAVQNGGGEGATSAEVPGRARRRRRCLYVGSLTRRKNAAGLVRAAVQLVSGGDVEFVFVGATGASFEESGVTVPEELADRVTFLGQVNDPATLEELYRSAAVFLFPSFYEASPLPPVEAMRWGCPVVVGDIPSLRERCGDAASYVDPGDVDAAVAEVRRLLDDDTLWDERQRAGLTQAATYSWETQARQVVDRVLDGVGA